MSEASSTPLNIGPWAEGDPMTDTVWKALVTEPNTGIGIFAIDGTIMYMNEQSARFLRGPAGKASDFIGRNVSEFWPKPWVDERKAILHKVLETGKPVLLRTIWKGYQQLAWIHHIASETPEPTEDEAGPGQEAPDQFLTITRRVGGDDKAEELAGEFETVESEVADLGPLEVLTPRELEVLALLGQGLSLKQIAKVLYRSVKTVDNHRASIGKKLAIDDRVKLAEIAFRAGLTVRDAERERV